MMKKLSFHCPKINNPSARPYPVENGTAGAILLSEWNGLTDWLMVGLNWHVQCLLKLDAVQEQFARLVERDFDFLVRLEPPGGNATRQSQQLMCVSVAT
ncbi:hypothetical protein ACTJLC_26395 [Paraburkholderia sp. 22099]|uniref:hypothetical protein n=1 Tax=Paraburkholderia sp. 22099 TaxID=3453875 RepID=UPI003F83FECC